MSYRKLKNIETAIRRKIRTKSYKLVKISSLAKICNATSFVIEKSSEIDGPSPKFFGINSNYLNKRYSVDFYSPELNLIRFSDVEVVGWSDFVIWKNHAAYPDVADISRDVQIVELEKRGRINLEEHSLSILPLKKPLHVKQGISLLGQSSSNYAHWLTEALARLAIADQFEEFLDFPILVDREVHDNILRSLSIFGLRTRKVIFVDKWQRVKVDNLVYLSPPSYTPADSRERVQSGDLQDDRRQDSLFSQSALTLVRQRIREGCEPYMSADFSNLPMLEVSSVFGRLENPSEATALQINIPGKTGEKSEKTPKRVFFRRAPYTTFNQREVANSHALEALLAKWEFIAADPTKLSFEELVYLMRDCRCVVSTVGAAVSNVIFSAAGCNVVVLAPYYKNASFSYFSALLSALGHKALFVMGAQVPDPARSVYKQDFYVDLAALEDALKNVLGEPKTQMQKADK